MNFEVQKQQVLAIFINEKENCHFFSCLDENYVVAGQEFYSCPVNAHLQGKNSQLPDNSHLGS